MKQYAHVDMDAFFVSVELLSRPELRGKPVVVGAPGDQRGVIAAASYEARKFGIHSAMPSRTAKRLCPDAVFLPGNRELYSKYSRKVRRVFERFTPEVHMTSIDEAYLDLTGTERLHGSAWRAVQAIQKAVASETKLPCSIGLGASCLVAKVASDLCKPRGLLWVLEGHEAAFLAPLPIRKIPGIGQATEKQLTRLRVRTVGDLARIPLAKLESEFGAWGSGLHRKARGRDGGLWFLEEEPKSISHERTFDHDVGDKERLEATLSYLSELVGVRLREAGLYARTIALKLRTADFKTVTRSLTLDGPAEFDSDIYQAVLGLFRHAWNKKKKVRLLGVTAENLVQSAGQLSLLDAPGRERQERVTAAADAVRERYGIDSVHIAKSMLRKPRKPRKTKKQRH